MQKLKTHALNEVLLYLQRSHIRPEQLATAALQRHQRELLAIDEILTNPSSATVQTSAAEARIEALEAELAAAKAQKPTTDAGEVEQLMAQLRQDFCLPIDASIDELYGAIADSRAEPEPQPTGQSDTPLRGRRAQAAKAKAAEKGASV